MNYGRESSSDMPIELTLGLISSMVKCEFTYSLRGQVPLLSRFSFCIFSYISRLMVVCFSSGYASINLFRLYTNLEEV